MSAIALLNLTALLHVRNCKGGEFTVIDAFVNFPTTNILQIEHGRCQVFVTKPVLKCTEATHVPFQIDFGKCVAELVKEPVAAKSTFSTTIAVLRGTTAAVQAGTISDLLQFDFEVFVGATRCGWENQIIGIRHLLAIFMHL